MLRTPENCAVDGTSYHTANATPCGALNQHVYRPGELRQVPLRRIGGRGAAGADGLPMRISSGETCEWLRIEC